MAQDDEREIFAVEPPRLSFKRSREGEFHRTISEIHDHTTFQETDNARELTIDFAGYTLAEGYRLTTWAFYQLCTAVCPGLFRFVMELSGQYRGAKKAVDDYSKEEAIDVFNRVVRRRFLSRLAGKQIVRNTKSRTIEGIVGAKYHWLPNLHLYERTKEILEQKEADVKFYEAVLNGRWLMLRFFDSDPIFQLNTPDDVEGMDSFLSGYHFSNSEVGQSSVRASTFLLRDIGRTSSISPMISGSRLRHAGRDFDQKFMMLLADIAEKFSEPKVIATYMQALSTTTIGLGLPTLPEEQERMSDLESVLSRRKLPPKLSKRIMASCIAQASYDEVRKHVAEVSRETLQKRNAFDFYNAICREAKRLSISTRERAEQIAYGLLVGKFRLNP